MKQILKMALVVMMVAFAVVSAGCGEEKDYHAVKAETMKISNTFDNDLPRGASLQVWDEYIKTLRSREAIVRKNMEKLEKLADAEPKLRPDLEQFKLEVEGNVYRNGIRVWIDSVNKKRKQAGRTDFEPQVESPLFKPKK